MQNTGNLRSDSPTSILDELDATGAVGVLLSETYTLSALQFSTFFTDLIAGCWLSLLLAWDEAFNSRN
jgi:hypothetical protein